MLTSHKLAQSANRRASSQLGTYAYSQKREISNTERVGATQESKKKLKIATTTTLLGWKKIAIKIPSFDVTKWDYEGI